MNFAFTNYSCNYSYTDKEKHKESFKNAACFSTLYYAIRRKEVDNTTEVKVTINKTPEEVENKRHNNYLTLNSEELKKWIQTIRREFGAKITYKESKTKVDVTIHSDNVYKMMFITTILRYCYEYPYSYFLKEAFRLKKMPGFTTYSLLELFNIIAVFQQKNSGLGHRIGPSMMKVPVLMPFEDRKRLVEELCKRENNLYMCDYYNVFQYYFEKDIYPYKNMNKEIDKLGRSALNNEDFWMLGENFESRYMKYYKFKKITYKYMKEIAKKIVKHREEVLEKNPYLLELKWIKKYL